MLNANSLSTNLFVTILVFLMVIVMPYADLRICRRLGLNLMGGVSSNPDAGKILRIRSALIGTVFAAYVAGFAYVVFFSRQATENYVVHTALFQDLAGSVQIDYGVLGFLKLLFTEGISSALSHFRIVYISGITQVYMNIMLFVPMGYLLPYVFGWFRERVKYRPACACFVISFATDCESSVSVSPNRRAPTTCSSTCRNTALKMTCASASGWRSTSAWVPSPAAVFSEKTCGTSSVSISPRRTRR